MASSTPGVLRRNRSIRLTQEAQVIPSTGRETSAATVVDGETVVVLPWATYSLGV